MKFEVEISDKQLLEELKRHFNLIFLLKTNVNLKIPLVGVYFSKFSGLGGVEIFESMRGEKGYFRGQYPDDMNIYDVLGLILSHVRSNLFIKNGDVMIYVLHSDTYKKSN